MHVSMPPCHCCKHLCRMHETARGRLGFVVSSRLYCPLLKAWQAHLHENVCWLPVSSSVMRSRLGSKKTVIEVNILLSTIAC